MLIHEYWYLVWFEYVSKLCFLGSGFNPQWDCTFNFTVHVPDLALVRFMVEDHDYTSSNDFLGQYTLPFSSLRTGACGDSTVWIMWGLYPSKFCSADLSFTSPGYRHVRLLKLDGSSLSPSSLFIHVKITPCQSSPSKSPAKSPFKSSIKKL